MFNHGRLLIMTVLVMLCLMATLLPSMAEEATEDYIKPDMVFIEGGTFEMGSCSSDPTAEPAHTVEVSSFHIGKYEVTNKEYKKFKPDHSGSWSNDKFAVENVSWNDAVAYCKWLSNKTGENYRLPTEAEWEYACRAGSTTEYYWGENMNQETENCPSIGYYAWYEGNSNMQVHSVGQKKANAWGLYDMSGNVWEWCNDWYDSSNQYRVMRGGGWISGGNLCQSGFRGGDAPTICYSFFGFRVVRTP